MQYMQSPAAAMQSRRGSAMGAGVYDSRGVLPSATPGYPTAADGTGDGNVSGRARLGSSPNGRSMARIGSYRNLSNNQNGSAGGSAGSGAAGPGATGPSSGAPSEPYGGGRKQSVGSANVRSNWDQVCPLFLHWLFNGFSMAFHWRKPGLSLTFR